MFKLLYSQVHFTCQQGNVQNPSSQALTVCEPMYKLDLEKSGEPEMKLPAYTESYKKEANSKKTSISTSLTVIQPLTVWLTTNCGKFLEMGIPDYLTCLLRNLQAGQEATVRARYGKMDWFITRKSVHQGCILSPHLFNFCAEDIRQNAGLDKSQAGIKLPRERSTMLHMQTILP